MRNAYLDDGDITVYAGDCIEVMRETPDASVDAIITDPPYGLEFMGREWDGFGTPMGFQTWTQAWATESHRILKPGAHLLAFGGTRTYHRLAAGIEDAGFEIRDCLAWLYGSGFPKSLDVSKAIDKAAGAEREVIGTTRGVAVSTSDNQHGGINRGAVGIKQTAVDVPLTAPSTDAAREWSGWGTALKPAFEPVVVARKPLTGTVAENVLEHGTGALNIDACRIGMSEADRATIESATWVGRNLDRKAYGTYATDGSDAQMATHPGGRWPANVALDAEAAALLDAQSGVTISGAAGAKGSSGFAAGYDGEYTIPYGDRGGASRFFYTAKASRQDRNTSGADNTHPTVKPTELMRWLIRLVTPPGGIILDPFGGSGSTGVAARAESVRCILIEREAEYLQIISDRLAQLSLFADSE